MTTPVLTIGPEAPPPSDNLANMRQLMQKLVNQVAEESRAETTRYQQDQQWKTFVKWCEARGFQSLPADPETVAVFIFTQGYGGKKSNTLRGYASSIAAKHRSEGHDSPCTDRVAMVCPASTIFAGWRQSVLPVHLLGLAPLLGCVGAVAGDVKLQDDGVMDHPVDCRGGGHGVGEDAFPLREDQV